MTPKLSFYGPFALGLFIIVGWAIFFYYISPNAVVDMIGIQNSYLVAFVLAVICGFTSLTGTTFYVAVAALAHGGANPLILGLVGGLGLCISDTAFYYFISRGTHVIDRHGKGLSTRMRNFMDNAPPWAFHLFIFCYSAFVPIPNDIVLVTFAVGHRPFKNIAPYLFAGDIISIIILAYISQ